MELIELEYALAQKRSDKRLFIEVSNTLIKTNR